jgi:uncharacterized membrane protein
MIVTDFEQFPIVPSDTDDILRSIRRWLLVLVSLHGFAMTVLALFLYDVTASYSLVLVIFGFLGGAICLMAGAYAITSSDRSLRQMD